MVRLNVQHFLLHCRSKWTRNHKKKKTNLKMFCIEFYAFARVLMSNSMWDVIMPPLLHITKRKQWKLWLLSVSERARAHTHTPVKGIMQYRMCLLSMDFSPWVLSRKNLPSCIAHLARRFDLWSNYSIFHARSKSVWEIVDPHSIDK